MLVIPTIVSADDIDLMPWEMFQNNASHTGYLKTEINDKAFSFAWKTYVGESTDDTLLCYIPQPVVYGNLVYVSQSKYFIHTLQAFSRYDGHQIWQKEFRDEDINPPAVVKGIVYAQTQKAVYGYDSNSGKILFKSPLEMLTYNLAPTIFEDQIYVAGWTYGGTSGGMYSLDASTGDNNWVSSLAHYDGWTPAVNKQYAITYTNGHLNVLDRLTGEVLVNIIDPHFKLHGYFTGFAPVMVSENEILTLHSGYLSLFNIANQNITWSKGSGFIGQPSYDGKFIYASRNDGLCVLDTSGKVSWNWYKKNEKVLGQMLVTKNLIFISTNKNVYAISKKRHEQVWAYHASGLLSMGMGHLYILDKMGNLISINVSSTAP